MSQVLSFAWELGEDSSVSWSNSEQYSRFTIYSTLNPAKHTCNNNLRYYLASEITRERSDTKRHSSVAVIE